MYDIFPYLSLNPVIDAKFCQLWPLLFMTCENMPRAYTGHPVKTLLSMSSKISWKVFITFKRLNQTMIDSPLSSIYNGHPIHDPSFDWTFKFPRNYCHTPSLPPPLPPFQQFYSGADNGHPVHNPSGNTQVWSIRDNTFYENTIQFYDTVSFLDIFVKRGYFIGTVLMHTWYKFQ